MSSEEQRYSIENQTAVISAYARRTGFDIVRTYVDVGKSGVTTAHRDGLKALLTDVLGDPPFSTILVTDVSRWGRFQDPDEAAHYEHLCREAGVRVEYCSEAFVNDGSPTSAILKSLKRVMAAEFSRQLSLRCRAGLRRSVLAGLAGGGSPGFGFRRQAFDADGRPANVLSAGETCSHINQQVRIVPADGAQIRTIRHIFRLFVKEDQGLEQIATTLNAAGTAHARPGRWTRSRVRAVLRNERVTGVFVYNNARTRLGAPVPLADQDWLRVKVNAPIVSVRLFAAAKKKLAAHGAAKLSRDEMIDVLRRLLETHGYLSHRLIDGNRTGPHVYHYVSEFGSAREACALAGFTLPPKTKSRFKPLYMDTPAMIAGLKALLVRQGYLSGPLIDATRDIPGAQTYRNRFGNLKNAYALIGYPEDRRERRDRRRRHAELASSQPLSVDGRARQGQP